MTSRASSPSTDWAALFAALGLSPATSGLQIVPAAALEPDPSLPHAREPALAVGGPALDHLLYLAPAFDPTRPLLVCASSPAEARRALAILRQHYPISHEVAVLDRGGAARRLPLGEVDDFGYLQLPPLPRLEVPAAFETLRYIVARLRGPGGCPWDREQTHASLKPYLVEEAYETLEALEEGDALKLREELGDLLLQVLLHAQLAAESGRFDLEDVVEGIARKLVRRHPHVFGEVQVADANEVLLNWDAIKRGEGVKSILNGVPKAMPALAYAQAVQRRAARAGFDWPSVDGVLDKVAEEVRELAAEEDKGREFGDLLFALVNVARWLQVDAEESLREASRRFLRRFNHMEAACAERGLEMESLSLDELDALWEQAKAEEEV